MLSGLLRVCLGYILQRATARTALPLLLEGLFGGPYHYAAWSSKHPPRPSVGQNLIPVKASAQLESCLPDGGEWHWGCIAAGFNHSA